MVCFKRRDITGSSCMCQPGDTRDLETERAIVELQGAVTRLEGSSHDVHVVADMLVIRRSTL